MIINGQKLLDHAPIIGMIDHKHHEHGVSSGLGEAGYDICIKQTVHFHKHPSTQMMMVGAEAGYIQPRLFEQGRFILASSIEEFNMPTNLVGIVHDKSSWARKGLSVFNTVIEPGWKGFLTLELVYHGDENLIIPAGAGIAQVIFTKTAEESCYEGKYQNQEDRPIEARQSKGQSDGYPYL